MPTNRENAIREGIQDAWDFYLAQHDVTVPDLIQEGIRVAFATWLDAHEDEVVNILRGAFRDWLDERARDFRPPTAPPEES